jgi:hypothetical protein
MRIRIIQRPGPQSIDGVRLDRFEPGYQYDVGHTLGALLLAERWAEPVSDDQPGLIVPFSETDPYYYGTQIFDGPSPASVSISALSRLTKLAGSSS